MMIGLRQELPGQSQQAQPAASSGTATHRGDPGVALQDGPQSATLQTGPLGGHPALLSGTLLWHSPGQFPD